MSQNPFKFLDSFGKADVDRFFGRDKETAQLFNAVHASNLVLLYGASGTGKTSLVFCGLANKFASSDWFPIAVRRGDDLNESLEAEVAERLGETRDAAGKSIPDYIRELYVRSYRPVYLIFDQFEELYILGSGPEQERFHRTVAQLLRADLECKVVIAIREEYIAELSEFERVVPALFDNRLRIELMNDRNLARVIVGTARFGEIAIEDGRNTVRAIIDNVRDKREGVDLANLQVYLDRLYREDVRRTSSDAEEVVFTPDLVAQVGRFENVLSDFLDERIGDIEAKLASERGLEKAAGLPLEILFTMVSDKGTKRPMDVGAIFRALPKNRAVSEADVLFCLNEFKDLRLVRQLTDG